MNERACMDGNLGSLACPAIKHAEHAEQCSGCRAPRRTESTSKATSPGNLCTHPLGSAFWCSSTCRVLDYPRQPTHLDCTVPNAAYTAFRRWTSPSASNACAPTDNPLSRSCSLAGLAIACLWWNDSPKPIGSQRRSTFSSSIFLGYLTSPRIRQIHFQTYYKRPDSAKAYHFRFLSSTPLSAMFNHSNRHLYLPIPLWFLFILHQAHSQS